jgi:acetyltransferase-like isoleucine patch superfamily enzyme
MLGVPIGRRLFDDGCAITENTLVRLGDGVFKADHIAVGSGVTFGAASYVHYGTTIGDNAVLAPDSFIMKGT